MSQSTAGKSRKPIRFLFENSLFLIGGAIAGLVWANASPEGYEHIKHIELWPGHHPENGGHAHNTLSFLVNDVLMAFFFAIAVKEVWEALLPGGSLRGFRRAAMPLIATLGGMV